MIKLHKKTLLILFFNFIFFIFNKAQANCPQSRVNRINEYLGQFSDLTAQFIQRSKNSSSTGVFFMKRPNLMKLIYDKPNIEFIYKNGKVVMYDRELDEFKRQRIYNFILRSILDGTIQHANLVCKYINETDNIISVNLLAKYDIAHKTSLELSFLKEDNKITALHSITNLDDESKIVFKELQYNNLPDQIFTISR